MSNKLFDMARLDKLAQSPTIITIFTLFVGKDKHIAVFIPAR